MYKQENMIEEAQTILGTNVLEKMKQGESFANIMANLPQEAFTKKEQCVCCSDGRFEPIDKSLDKAGMAGQGILELFSDFGLEKLVKNMTDQKPKVIASHTGCGAAGLAFKRLKAMMEQGNQLEEVERIFNFLGISELPSTSDKLGEIFTERLASLSGSQYEHIAEGKTEEHNESGIIVSCLPFDERYILDSGQQFFNSASLELGASVNYLRLELTELSRIAFHHGKMENNQEDFFYLLVITDQSRSEEMRRVANEVASNPEFGGRIKVEEYIRTNPELN
jgi:hypothetical protein